MKDITLEWNEVYDPQTDETESFAGRIGYKYLI